MEFKANAIENYHKAVMLLKGQISTLLEHFSNVYLIFRISHQNKNNDRKDGESERDRDRGDRGQKESCCWEQEV